MLLNSHSRRGERDGETMLHDVMIHLLTGGGGGGGGWHRNCCMPPG